MTQLLADIFYERGPIKTIGVIGMGYVGIPAAALFAQSFNKVYGFQRDSTSSGYKISLLNSGKEIILAPVCESCGFESKSINLLKYGEYELVLVK